MTAATAYIAAWGMAYPQKRPTAHRLWAEAEAAYRWFCEPGIAVEEAQWRWALVVHLVHNFKSQQFIRDAAADWPTAGAAVAAASQVDRPTPTGLQREIIGCVDLSWTSVRGFGLATTSALLALLHPDRCAIIDRFTSPVLVALARGPAPRVEDRHGLVDWSERLHRHRHSGFYEGVYMPTLHDMVASSDCTLQSIERGLFLLGESLKNIQGWDAYRQQLDDRLPRGQLPPSERTSP